MFDSMVFFVLIREKNNEFDIRRLHLDRDAQKSLCAIFKEAKDDLIGEDIEIIDFEVGFRCDIQETQKISNYRMEDSIINAIGDPISIELFAPSNNEYPNIRAIFTGVTKPELLIAFQKFDQGQYIANKRLSLFYSEDILKKVNFFGMNINTRIDCVYKDNSLFFKSYHIANQIFDLAMYYRSASDGDVNDFMNNKKFMVTDKDVFIANADTWVRKKIAFIQDSGVLEYNTVDQILEQAQEVNININIDTDKGIPKIVLPEEKKEMKELLKFFAEDVYKGLLSNTSYVTNSKRILNN